MKHLFFSLFLFLSACSEEPEGLEDLDAAQSSSLPMDAAPARVADAPDDARDAQAFDASSSSPHDAETPASDAHEPASLLGTWRVQRTTQDAQPCFDFSGNVAFPSAAETWTITAHTTSAALLTVNGSKLRAMTLTPSPIGATFTMGAAAGFLELHGATFTGALTITQAAPTAGGQGSMQCTTTQAIEGEKL